MYVSVTALFNYVIVDLPENQPFNVIGPLGTNGFYSVECNKCHMKFLITAKEICTHTKEECLLYTIHNS
jgi:hypothetical protein